MLAVPEQIAVRPLADGARPDAERQARILDVGQAEVLRIDQHVGEQCRNVESDESDRLPDAWAEFWPAGVRAASREVRAGEAGLALPVEPTDDVGREALELIEIVIARRQDHVLDAGRFEVADALDDLARGPEEVRLLEILERAMGAHHALEDRPLKPERFLAIRGVDEMGEVQVAVAQRVWFAPDLRAVVADGADVVLDHLLAAGRAGEPPVGRRA